MAGSDAFLLKPLRLEKLSHLLQQLLDLEWQYAHQNNEAPPPTTAPLIAPPVEELEALFDLAQLGKMGRLRKRVTQLEQADQQYLPLAQKLRDLAQKFDREQILSLLQELTTTTTALTP